MSQCKYFYGLISQLPLKNISLMNRDKSAHHRRNNRPTTHERDQNNHHTSLTKYSTSKVSQAEKVTELSHKIMTYVNRYQQPQSQYRIITRETIRDGGSKLFYDVFAMLGRVIDDRMEASDLNPEIVTGILHFYRYPGQMNKNIFQPIGAPHTWLHCLNILDFIGEVANYTAAFKAHCESVEKSQAPPEGDHIYLERKAVLENDPEIVTRALQRQQEMYDKKVQEMKQQCKSLEEDIKKMHKQQPPLSEIEAANEEERKLISKQEGEIAKKERQEQQLEMEMARIKEQISKSQNELTQLDLQLDHLNYRLEHNELTQSETDKLHEEVRQCKIQHHTLTNELENTREKIRDGLRKNISTLKQSYARVHTCLNQINSLSIDGQVLGEAVPFVDNFNELEDLCFQYLNTEEIKEGSLRMQFQDLTAKWQLPTHSNKAYQINDQISQKVKTKERTKIALEKDNQHLSKEYEQLNQQYQALMRIHTTSNQEAEKLKLKNKDLQMTLERVKTEKQRMVNENKALLRYRIEYEEETQRIMDEVDRAKAEGDIFEQRMKEQERAIELTIEESKAYLMRELEAFRDNIFQTYDKSEQKQLMDEVLEELAPEYSHLLEQEEGHQ